MVIPILAAKKGADVAGGAAKALTGDIFVSRWTQVVGTGKHKKVVERELHVNPITVGVGAVAVGGAALLTGAALWFMQKKPVVSQGKDLVRIAEEKETTYKSVVDEPAVPAWTEQVLVSDAWTQNLGPELISGGHLLPSTQLGWKCIGCGATIPYVVPTSDEVTDARVAFFISEHEDHGYGVTEWWSIEEYVEPVYGEDVLVYHAAVYETIEHPAVDATYKEVIDKEGYTQYYTQSGIPLWKKDQLYVTNDALTQREISGGYMFVEEFKQIGMKHWWRFHSDSKTKIGTGERTGLFT